MILGSLQGKRILITGGLGFVGSNLAHRCLRDGAQVTILDIHAPRSGANRQNLVGLERDLQLIEGDIRDAVAVERAMDGADVVFHCAALTSHPISMEEPILDMEVNVKGTLVILESIRARAKKGGTPPRLVFVATSTQLGRMVMPVADEMHPEFPLDIYSTHKLAAEKLVLLYSRVHGLPGTVVRLANNYGPRACIRTHELGFINYFVGLALQGKSLTVFGEGKQLRSVSYIDDSVDALIAAALDDRALGEVFFATSDTQISLMSVAQEIARVVGGSVSSVPWPAGRQAIEVGDAVISNQKAHSRLGWAPKTSFEDGLMRTREYFAPVLKEYL